MEKEKESGDRLPEAVNPSGLTVEGALGHVAGQTIMVLDVSELDPASQQNILNILPSLNIGVVPPRDYDAFFTNGGRPPTAETGQPKDPVTKRVFTQLLLEEAAEPRSVLTGTWNTLVRLSHFAQAKQAARAESAAAGAPSAARRGARPRITLLPKLLKSFAELAAPPSPSDSKEPFALWTMDLRQLRSVLEQVLEQRRTEPDYKLPGMTAEPLPRLISLVNQRFPDEPPLNFV